MVFLFNDRLNEQPLFVFNAIRYSELCNYYNTCIFMKRTIQQYITSISFT